MSSTPVASQRARTNGHSVRHWTAVCQSCARGGHTKRAEMGGERVPFEQALSNLAHAFLRERAPQLIPYELGFQLLEKNEDNDRAVGVFGFKVGPQLLYAPVFFLNGELKGHELLWLKDSDTFIPMEESWINYILNRKPTVLGETVDPDLRMLGAERPAMRQFRDSPSKYASVQPAWLQVGLPGLMYAKGRHVAVPPAVPELVKSSAWAAHRFLQMIDVRPQLAEKFAQCYGTDLLKCAVDVARTITTVCPIEQKREKRAKTITGSIWRSTPPCHPNADLRIWVYDGTRPSDLDEKQAATLKRDGVYIADMREDKNTSQVLNVQFPLAMQNPDQTGIYEILTKPDSFDRCLFVDKPQGDRGRKTGCVLVRIGDDDNKAYTVTHPAKVFAVEKESGEEYDSYWQALPEAKNLERGATYMLLTPSGQGTYPFEVEETMPSEGEETCYKIWWKGGYGDDRPDCLPSVARRESFYEYEGDSCCDLISLNRIKGKNFVNRIKTLFVPPGTKMLRLKKSRLPNDYKHPEPIDPKNSEPPALRPGRHIDLQMGIYKTSSELKVINTGSEAWINGTRLPTKAALISLMKDYGLREKAARDVLGKAQSRGGHTWRIKYAQPYGAQANVPFELQQGGPYAPPIPTNEQTGQDTVFGSMTPTQEYMEEEYAVPALETTNARPNYALPPEPETMNQVMQAAQTGQQEILDTSVLSNLLNASRDDTLIDQHLPNLVKGLDSIGRLLFNFYWHHDRYEDRFDAGELPELEDAMRNSFENLGELTLKLKQKAIEPYVGESTDVDLEPPEV